MNSTFSCMDLALLVLTLFILHPLTYSQPNIPINFHLGECHYVYSNVPSFCDCKGCINRLRISKSKIKTCTIYESRKKGKKFIEPRKPSLYYRYNEAGFVAQSGIYYLVGDSIQLQLNDPRPSFPDCGEPCENLLTNVYGIPPSSLAKMEWAGDLPGAAELNAIGGRRDTTYFDSARGMVTKEYLIDNGVAARVVQRFNKQGELIEVAGISAAGLRIYFNQRMRTADGFVSRSVNKKIEGDFEQSIRYDSLGYRIYEGTRYIPKDSSRAELKKAANNSRYRTYTYDPQHNMIEQSYWIREKQVERIKFYYGPNMNLIKEEFLTALGDVKIKEFEYTFFD